MRNSVQRRRSPDRMLHQTLSKGWCRHGSGLLLGLIVRLRRRLVEARALLEAATPTRSACIAHRLGGFDPGHPRPVVAPLQKREGLLALRLLSPALLLPEPLLPGPVQPQGTSPGARAARLAASPRRGTLRSFGRLPRDGHDPYPGHRAGEGFAQGALLRASDLRQERLQDLRWVYGFKVALVVDPGGVITAFFLAAASSDERPIGDALVASDRHEAYLWQTKGLRGCSGSVAGWSATGRWLPPHHTTTPAGRGRRPIVVGRPASARS